MSRPANPKSVFATRLRQARTRLGLSQSELGRRAGLEPEVASPRINQYERGAAEPRHATAKRLAKELGVPTAFLYAEDPKVARLLLAWTKLSAKDQAALLVQLEGSTGDAAKPAAVPLKARGAPSSAAKTPSVPSRPAARAGRRPASEP